MPRFIRDLVRNSLDHIGITSYHRYAIRQWISSFSSQHRQRYRESLKFHSQFIQRGDLVFDVGANIGNRTEIYLSLGARVVAIEPQSRCVEFLESRFADKKDIIIVPTAVGAAEAKETLFVSDSSTISSMSPEWIQAVKESGRFTQHRWDEATTIDVTTLDSLIDKYGKPSFIKIDTEGYELPVLKGLSHPITTISFEFTPELIQVAYACIRHLDRQFEYLFNYSVGESMKCELAEYTTAEEVTRLLADIPSEVFGDVYARIPR
jgi:FkbM family methyltransferase